MRHESCTVDAHKHRRGRDGGCGLRVGWVAWAKMPLILLRVQGLNEVSRARVERRVARSLALLSAWRSRRTRDDEKTLPRTYVAGVEDTATCHLCVSRQAASCLLSCSPVTCRLGWSPVCRCTKTLLSVATKHDCATSAEPQFEFCHKPNPPDSTVPHHWQPPALQQSHHALPTAGEFATRARGPRPPRPRSPNPRRPLCAGFLQPSPPTPRWPHVSSPGTVMSTPNDNGECRCPLLS